MRRITMWVAAAVIGLVGSVMLLVGPASAAIPPESPQTFINTIVGAPDNDPGDCTTWARSDLTRTTTITFVEPGDGPYGVWHVRVDSVGPFTTSGGITGILTGYVEYTMEGNPNPEKIAENDGEEFDFSSYGCKGEVPSKLGVGQWARMFFGPHVKAHEITAWEYIYDTGCEQFVENDQSGAVGIDFVFTKICSSPTPTTSPSPSVEPSPSATPVQSESPAPGLAGGADDGEQLPATGASLPLITGIGAGLLGVGVGLFFLARRRRGRYHFTA